jgi:hypothetical protein
MNGSVHDIIERIDRKTSRSICDAVGERLQREIRPQFFEPSPYLDHLVDELRKQDERRDHH